MSKSLKIAHDLALPADEAITQKYGFIGRSGSGKSYAAMRLAELFLAHGGQVIALDWVGIWWSLRLAANGKTPGFEHVYIFGGEHADVDLRPESGALMADLVVDKHISVVLDVMHFRKAERTRFATAFAEQFFHRKKTARTACHLFIEEAQAYLPQMVRGEEARMVGVFEDIGKVGRNYGIGNSLISQRPQAINKDVLNQVEVLLAFQTNGPQERKAIAGWTAENTTAGTAMIQALPTLEVGHALVWSPQWLRVAKPIHITTRETYDASSTPTQRAKAIAPKTLAKADLDALGAEIQASIEKAKADDPRELRKSLAEKDKRIKELEARAPGFPPSSEGKKTEVPVLTDADRELLRTLGAEFHEFTDAIATRADNVLLGIAERARAEIDQAVTQWSATLEKRRALFLERLEKTRVQRTLDKLSSVSNAVIKLPTSTHHAERPGPSRPLPAAPPGRASVATRPATRPASPDAAAVGDPEQRVLNALAWFAAAGVDRPTRHQVAFLARYTVNGHFNNTLGGLRNRGLLEYPGPGLLTLTSEGQAFAESPDVTPTKQGMVDAVMAVLREEPARRVFGVVAAQDGRAISREELASATNYTVNGHFNNTVGTLRTLGAVTYPSKGMVALGEIFEAFD